uniref:Uncharacterized protein n=1 Tax=Glossina brevipalpis TaxID=37001 RepID=A0A1A9X5L7_9MUSC
MHIDDSKPLTCKIFLIRRSSGYQADYQIVVVLDDDDSALDDDGVLDDVQVDDDVCNDDDGAVG